MRNLIVVILVPLSLICALAAHQKTAVVIPSAEDLHPILLKGQYGFIDGRGKLRFTLPKTVFNVREFSEGLAAIGVKLQEDSTKWGYINTSGEIAISPEYERARTFSEGMAAVHIGGKWGFINKTGELVVKPSFYSLSDGSEMRFSENLAAITYASAPDPSYRYKYGYIDKRGELVIKPQFGIAHPFSGGLAAISFEERGKSPNPKYGYINKEGKVIIPPQFIVAKSFSEGLAMVQVSKGTAEKVGYIDASGRMVIPPQFDDVYDRVSGLADLREPSYWQSGKERDFAEGVAAVKIDGKWGYVDKSGKIVISPQFVYAGQFKSGLAAVALKKFDKRIYGFIKKDGQFAILPQYDSVHEFKNDLAAIFFRDSSGETSKWGYINKTGRYVWQPTK